MSLQSSNIGQFLKDEHFLDIIHYEAPANWINSGFIVTATSKVHIASFLNRAKKLKFFKKSDINGNLASEWVIVNFADSLIHIFTQATREYYELDKFWEEKTNGKRI